MRGRETAMTDYCEVSSPVGRLLLSGRDGIVSGIAFAGTPDSAWKRDRAPFARAISQLEEYFEGERREFDLPLAPEGTPFQREVWAMLRRIPYGETVSYGELARRIGRPGAARAVGAANGRNPIPIVIPCHRVVGADGSLTGFGGGIDVKRRLLALEAKHRPSPGPSSARDLFD